VFLEHQWTSQGPRDPQSPCQLEEASEVTAEPAEQVSCRFFLRFFRDAVEMLNTQSQELVQLHWTDDELVCEFMSEHKYKVSLWVKAVTEEDGRSYLQSPFT